MFINILMVAILIVATIFFLGFIGHLIYLLVTPSNKLSTEDFNKKNILFKYFKNIKILYQKPKKSDWCFILIPDISLCYLKYNNFNVYYLCLGWLFWEVNIKFKREKKIIN